MKHKKQHWVPRSYLSAWCDPTTPEGQEPYVWVFPWNGGAGRRKAPHNIFAETDMYTIHGRSGARDLRLERGLSELEDRFSTLRREKFEARVELEPLDQFMLAVFVAAMHSRSRRQRDHQRKEWGRLLETLDRVHDDMMRRSPEEREQIARLMMPPSDRAKTMSHADVRRLASEPLQNSMAVAIETMASLLVGMDLAILSTDDRLGFIASDAPCVVFDPEAYKRPFLHRAPGLMYPTVEVTLPISPRQTLVYNRAGLSGFQKTTPMVVDILNQRTLVHADDEIVVCQNETRAAWFEPEPIRAPDSDAQTPNAERDC